MTYLVEGLDACTDYNISVKVEWEDGTANEVETIEVTTEPAGTEVFMNKTRLFFFLNFPTKQV